MIDMLNVSLKTLTSIMTNQQPSMAQSWVFLGTQKCEFKALVQAVLPAFDASFKQWRFL